MSLGLAEMQQLGFPIPSRVIPTRFVSRLVGMAAHAHGALLGPRGQLLELPHCGRPIVEGGWRAQDLKA